jgi:thymidylate synthase (FAD)
MTKQEDIRQDPRYIPLHDYGFVGLIDTMGSDQDIAAAARLSYGTGTKTVSEDRNLIRYLIRHKHTSPLEMAEVKFHIKTPIFVMRQLVRHRTANLNEYSARYSVLSNEFYIPSIDYLAPQSTTNKQGRSGEINGNDRAVVSRLIAQASQNAYELYQLLLGADEFPDDATSIRLDAGNHGFTPEYPGLARELARSILPVNNYTELYWKCDLHNFFHFARLRRDSHAQQEIQDFANAMYALAKPHFPLAAEAFEDYLFNSMTLSAMEITALKDMLNGTFETNAEHYGMLKREFTEFTARFVPSYRHFSALA